MDDRDADALDAMTLLASAAQKVWERSDKLTLNDVCERLGVDVTRTHHGRLSDACGRS